MPDSAIARTNAEVDSVSFTRFAGYFLWLGTVGFGGPIALAGHMQQDLVDSRRWISKQDYLDGLALAQLAPGPLAAQLAMYLGYVHAGIIGATAVARSEEHSLNSSHLVISYAVFCLKKKKKKKKKLSLLKKKKKIKTKKN